jgi:hypothetical protein
MTLRKGGLRAVIHTAWVHTRAMLLSVTAKAFFCFKAAQPDDTFVDYNVAEKRQPTIMWGLNWEHLLQI